MNGISCKLQVSEGTSLLHVALGLMPAVPEHVQQSYPIKKYWHVLYTGMRQELEAKRGVHDLGFETFLPMSSRRSIKRGKRVIINDPLFTRYVFVAFDREKDEWGPIQNVDGAEYILGSDGKPSTVPDGFVDRLKRLEQAGAFDYTQPKLNFSEGDSVEIQEGPFAGLIAKVKSASPKKRVKLLLDSLASIEIDPSFIVRVAP